jgi:xanthine dehydrogenase YagS FAD-binding subunit
MNSFSYQRAGDVAGALQQIRTPGAKFIGGGSNLLDLMKGGIERPVLLIDINRLPLSEITAKPDGGVRIGALARNSDVAAHPLVRRSYPLLTQALLSGASPQLRNMATVGGNLMQRTRCGYFYDTAFEACNKRAPGSGCAALEGYNRNHAIFGASAQCIAVNPSDMNVALTALDAVINLEGPNGARSIAMADFHRLPGDTPQRDTNLEPDELIVSVDLPDSRFSNHAHYLKVRDRASYAFALVSVAAALDLDGGRVRAARIVLGGVAHKPWRATAAEAVLRGRPLTAETLAEAGRAAVDGARAYPHNGFKIELARRTVERALALAGGGLQ